MARTPLDLTLIEPPSSFAALEKMRKVTRGMFNFFIEHLAVKT